jgi:hypothetical protein
MTDADALTIIRERRATMYDPVIVDAFTGAYQRIMPAPETLPHPAARAVGAGRTKPGAEVTATLPGPGSTPPMLDELAAFTSLSRAVCGEAGTSDVGALVWMMVRQVVPCGAMALFVPDEASDMMVARYAAGSRAAALRHERHPMSQGPVGWTAVNRRAIANAEARVDPAQGSASDEPGQLHWVCTMPLVHDDVLIAVVALYSGKAAPFSEQQAQLLELCTPRLAAAFASLDTRHSASHPVEGLPAPLRIVRRA